MNNVVPQYQIIGFRIYSLCSIELFTRHRFVHGLQSKENEKFKRRDD